MWQQEKQHSGIVRLALVLALTTSPVTTNLLLSAAVLAQSSTETPTFSVPPTLASGTAVRIDGYSGANIFNQNLQQSFQQQFTGTKVEIAANGTEAALKSLLDGQVDIAAIGRGLTPEEKAQGLEQVRLHREKIAIIVGADNPFQGSLTDRQFARIFRGRITNWSQVGGTSAKIRVIDRPSNSGTREALSNYPVFRATKFATGTTATQIPDDDTAAIAKQLGKDGISYARANQVAKLPGVRVLKLHDTLPDDSKYPFSQPLVYVYKKNPNPTVAAFLGFALAPQGQQAIEAARNSEAEAIAKGEALAVLAATTPVNTAETTSTPTATATATSPAATATTPEAINTPLTFATPATTISPFLDSNNTTSVNNLTTPAVVAPPATPPTDSRNLLWWLLLPIAAIGGGLVWFLRRPTTSETESAVAESEPVKEPVAVGTLADTNTISASVNDSPNLSQSPLPLPPELEQSPWDMEAPATIVNTSYPQIVETPKADYVSEKTSELTVNQVVESSQPEPETEIVATPETETNIWAVTETPETENQVELPAPTIPETVENLPDVSADEQIDESSNISSELPASEPTEIQSIFNEPEAAPVAELELPDVPLDEQISWPDESDADNTNLETLFGEPETTTSNSTELPSVADIASEDIWDSDVNAELPSLDELEAPETTTEPVTSSLSGEVGEDSLTNLPQFATIPADALNSVADAAEINELDTLEDKENPVTDNLANLAGGAAAVGVGIAAWAGLAGNTANSEVVEPTSTANTPVEDLPTVDHISANSAHNDEDSSVVIKPRSADWAYVSWYISVSDRQQMQNQGVSHLLLRLYDVNEIDLSYQEPALVQQYECETNISDHYVYVPVSDRNYIVEVGYLTTGDRWVKIARSQLVRVFGSLHSENTPADAAMVDTESQVFFTPRTPKWAYISWQISQTRQQTLRNAGISQVALRLYDVTNIDLSYQTPQLVQQYECEEIVRSRYIAIPYSERDYMVELGYLADSDRWVVIARSENVHIFSPPHGDFWFVADAELIIHGATEPGATVNIAGQAIALKSDGTFHLRVPFSEDIIEYLITVSAANSNQTTSLHKKFSQETLA